MNKRVQWLFVSPHPVIFQLPCCCPRPLTAFLGLKFLKTRSQNKVQNFYIANVISFLLGHHLGCTSDSGMRESLCKWIWGMNVFHNISYLESGAGPNGS